MREVVCCCVVSCSGSVCALVPLPPPARISWRKSIPKPLGTSTTNKNPALVTRSSTPAASSRKEIAWWAFCQEPRWHGSDARICVLGVGHFCREGDFPSRGEPSFLTLACMVEGSLLAEHVSSLLSSMDSQAIGYLGPDYGHLALDDPSGRWLLFASAPPHVRLLRLLPPIRAPEWLTLADAAHHMLCRFHPE